MIIRMLGGEALAWLLSQDRSEDLDSSWLLFGPSDERYVEPAADAPAQTPLRWAAE